MKVTQNHIDFYYRKKYPVPAFGPTKKISIHDLINSQIDIKFNHDMHNILNLLRISRRINRPLQDKLKKLYSSDTKRTAIAKRWYDKINRGKHEI